MGFLFTDPTAQLIMPTALEDVMLSLRRIIRNRDERTKAALAALEAGWGGTPTERLARQYAAAQAAAGRLSSVPTPPNNPDVSGAPQ